MTSEKVAARQQLLTLLRSASCHPHRQGQQLLVLSSRTDLQTLSRASGSAGWLATTS